MTFEQLQAIARLYDFHLEYREPDGEGGGDEFELFSNKYAPGVTGVYETLEEAAADVLALEQGTNPLSDIPVSLIANTR